MNEIKVYLNTAEDIVDALQKGEAVYKDDANGDIKVKYYIYKGIIISDWGQGRDKFINSGSLLVDKNRYYVLEKEPLKFEWGKFYKTAKGEKALYYAEHKNDKGNSLYFFCVDKCKEFRTNALGKDIDFNNDIVDYWEDEVK